MAVLTGDVQRHLADATFSTQGNGTMTIVKEKSPTSFEVEQNLKTWPSNGARTIAFDSKAGHLFAMRVKAAFTGRGCCWRCWRPRRWSSPDSGFLHDHHGRHQIS